MQKKSAKIRIAIRIILLLLFASYLWVVPLFLPGGIAGVLKNAGGAEPLGQMTDMTVTRLLAGGIFFVLLFDLGYPVLSFRRVPSLKTLLSCIPALVVVLNNFPILGLLSGRATLLHGGWYPALLFLMCFAIGFFEESAFRGVIFLCFFERATRKRGATDSDPENPPDFCQKRTKTGLKNTEKHGRKIVKCSLLISPTKQDALLSILLTSLVFGAIHLLNLFEGASLLSVLLQVGYSFLIGGMCAVVLLKTHCLWFPILLHTLFDFGGYLIPMLGRGTIWDPVTVAVTAVLGVLTTVYFVWLFFRTPDEELLAVFGTRKSSAENRGEEKSGTEK